MADVRKRSLNCSLISTVKLFLTAFKTNIVQDVSNWKINIWDIRRHPRNCIHLMYNKGQCAHVFSIVLRSDRPSLYITYRETYIYSPPGLANVSVTRYKCTGTVKKATTRPLVYSTCDRSAVCKNKIQFAMNVAIYWWLIWTFIYTMYTYRNRISREFLFSI